MEDIKKDAKIIIKQIFDSHHYGVVQYHEENSDNKMLGAMKVTLKRDTGQILGIGYGCKNEAKTEAAKNAIKNLENMGITESSGRAHNAIIKDSTASKMDFLTGQVAKNIKIYNQKNSRSAPIYEYRINMIPSQVPKASVSIAYGYSSDKLTWKDNEHVAFADPHTKEPLSAKVNVLEKFNKYLKSF